MVAAIGLGLVALTFYFSVLSMALRGHSRARLADLLGEEGQRRWYDRLDRDELAFQGTVSSIRLAASVGMIVWILYAKLVAEPHVTAPLDASALLVPTILMLAFLFVFAVGIPGAVANHAGEVWLARSLPLIWALRIPLFPAIQLMRFFDFVVRRLAGRPEVTPEVQTQRLEDEILNAVTEGELHGAVDEEQKEIIQSVFELNETTVTAIMTPRTEIEALSADGSYEDARQSILRAGHSRIPVYEKTIDHVIGVLYAKDLLRLGAGEPFDARKLMRAAPYVPETKTLAELLDEFRRRRVQIAIVLDEYGGTAGLCTIEDILEELVGEIDDEYDQPEAPSIQRVDDDTLEVDARVSVSEVNAELGIEIPEDGDYETIGGFVLCSIGKIPARGESMTHENIEIRVVDAEPRKINRLRVRVQREAPAA